MIIHDRNPDVNLDLEAIPEGMQLIEGKNLMCIARGAKIPYGVASKRISRHHGHSTIGLVIRAEDIERFRAAETAHHNNRRRK